jgi:hypothetical protein
VLFLAEGAVSDDLTRWRVPCLICIGSGDADFIEQARQAAHEIPARRSSNLVRPTIIRPTISEDEVLRDAVLSSLRANS